MTTETASGAGSLPSLIDVPDGTVPASFECAAHSHLEASSMDPREDAEAAYANDPDRLWNDSRPPEGAAKRKHEQPEHRIMIMLKAQGLSNIEIARRTNYSAVAVNDILRQPWARTRLTQEIHAAGAEPIAALLRAAAPESIVTLIEVRDNENAPSAARVAAANSLLDRYLGKPTQRLESYDGGNAPSAGDIAELDRQLATAEAEEKRLMGSN